MLRLLFLVVKSKPKRAKIYTWITQTFYDKRNEIEYDALNDLYWIKSKPNYLKAVDQLYCDFGKKNLYWFIEQVYCKHYIPKKGDVIIDLGAGIGTETLYFSEHVGETGKVHSIEASPDSFHKLDLLTRKNKFINTSNYHCAITNYNGKIWIEETENFIENQVNTDRKGLEVNCFTLDRFVEDNDIKRIDLLKVNIEGAEQQMLEGMEASIHLVQNVSISCHDFLFKEDRKIREQVVSFFEANHFKMVFNDTNNTVVNSWIYGERTRC